MAQEVPCSGRGIVAGIDLLVGWTGTMVLASAATCAWCRQLPAGTGIRCIRLSLVAVQHL